MCWWNPLFPLWNIYKQFVAENLWISLFYLAFFKHMVKTVSVDSQKAPRCKKEALWTFIKRLEISDVELFTGHHFITFQSIYIYLMLS